MTTAYLAAVQEGDKWMMRVLESRNAFLKEGRPPGSFRLSPVFPVNPEKATVASLQNATIFGFFTLDSPFLAIGESSASLQERIWFSHGLASVILPSVDVAEITGLAGQWKAQLRAVETWTFTDGRIQSNVEFASPATVEDKHCQLVPFSTLKNTDLLTILGEIQLNVFELAGQAAQHLPDYLQTLERVVQAINEIIHELHWFEDTSKPAPKSFSKRMMEGLRSAPADRIHRRINQRVDTLIQINSSLTYILSQAFYGTSPILENRTLIGTYALLGIGTAWRAMSRLTAHIESTFDKFPIVKAVKQYYGRKHTGVNVRFDRNNVVPATADWSQTRFTVDEYLEEIENVTTKPKLVCYSGRLGFGETEFTITAATQVLQASDSLRWSMMTLTHELLHAHVHALLAVIFRLPHSSPIEDAHQQHIHAYRASQHNPGDPLVGESLAQSLVFAVFEYSKVANIALSWQRQARKGSASLGKAPLHDFDDDDFTQNYRDREPFMEEIMVHVLDLHYFYQGNSVLYLDLLWDSWSTVPAVIEHLEEYILRSLAAVASNLTGQPLDRLEAAIRLLGEAMQRLNERDPNNPLVQRVTATLSDPKLRASLRAGFPASLYIADITKRFFHSEKLQSALCSGDENIQKTDGTLMYRLTIPEFSGTTVANPLAFILDRLRRCASKEITGIPENYRSACLFLAAASPPSKEGN
jgi:hypothetical protein